VQSTKHKNLIIIKVKEIIGSLLCYPVSSEQTLDANALTLTDESWSSEDAAGAVGGYLDWRGPSETLTWAGYSSSYYTTVNASWQIAFYPRANLFSEESGFAAANPESPASGYSRYIWSEGEEIAALPEYYYVLGCAYATVAGVRVLLAHCFYSLYGSTIGPQYLYRHSAGEWIQVCEIVVPEKPTLHSVAPSFFSENGRKFVQIVYMSTPTGNAHVPVEYFIADDWTLTSEVHDATVHFSSGEAIREDPVSTYTTTGDPRVADYSSPAEGVYVMRDTVDYGFEPKHTFSAVSILSANYVGNSLVWLAMHIDGEGDFTFTLDNTTTITKTGVNPAAVTMVEERNRTNTRSDIEKWKVTIRDREGNNVCVLRDTTSTYVHHFLDTTTQTSTHYEFNPSTFSGGKTTVETWEQQGFGSRLLRLDARYNHVSFVRITNSGMYSRTYYAAAPDILPLSPTTTEYVTTGGSISVVLVGLHDTEQVLAATAFTPDEVFIRAYGSGHWNDAVYDASWTRLLTRDFFTTACRDTLYPGTVWGDFLGTLIFSQQGVPGGKGFCSIQVASITEDSEGFAVIGETLYSSFLSGAVVDEVIALSGENKRYLPIFAL